MERLTVKGPSGLISLKDKSENGANQAIKCLSEYEDTGLTPEQIRELAERDTPKIPIYQVQGDERYEQEPEWWECPNCGEIYDMDEDCDFCPNCGQRLLR